jgi:ABC-type uncharacterized transport system YnjBCD ATPase subunit
LKAATGFRGVGDTASTQVTSTSGSIFFDGQDYTRFSAFQRNIGMVFQSYAWHCGTLTAGPDGIRKIDAQSD